LAGLPSWYTYPGPLSLRILQWERAMSADDGFGRTAGEETASSVQSSVDVCPEC